MNESCDPAERLAQAIAAAQWVVVDMVGNPGRRVLSLHTSLDAAGTMLRQLKQPDLSILPRANLDPRIMAELDQVVEAIKREPALLAMSEQELLDVDTFSVFDAVVLAPAAPQPSPSSLLVTKEQLEQALARRVAEGLFIRLCGVPDAPPSFEYLARCCFDAGEAFARVALSRTIPDPKDLPHV